MEWWWSKLSANIKLFYTYFDHANKLPLFILNASLHYKRKMCISLMSFMGEVSLHCVCVNGKLEIFNFSLYAMWHVYNTLKITLPIKSHLLCVYWATNGLVSGAMRGGKEMWPMVLVIWMLESSRIGNVYKQHRELPRPSCRRSTTWVKCGSQ